MEKALTEQLNNSTETIADDFDPGKFLKEKILDNIASI